ncbi:hypothetical protein Lser_V15G37254 [Lactuca serriola]
MSHNANSSDGSSSLNVNEYDEWEAQVVQQNRQLDVIMSELLIGIPNMSVRDHPRARRRYCDREREQGEARLMKDYFVDNPMYGEENFRGRQGLLPLQKCIGAMRVLAYRTSADTHDEYLRINKTVTRDALVKFVEGVISCFREEYLRRPNQDDLARLLHVGEEHGFPGRAPKVSYTVNDQEKHMAYYLIDGIYPSWAAFVKSRSSPQLRKHKLFAEHQEAARKDV